MAQTPRPVDGRTHTRNAIGQRGIQSVSSSASLSVLSGSASAIETRSKVLRYGIEARSSPRSVNRPAELHTPINTLDPRVAQSKSWKIVPSQSRIHTNHNHGIPRTAPSTVRSVVSGRSGINAARSVRNDILDYSISSRSKQTEIPTLRAITRHARHTRSINNTRSATGITSIQKDPATTPISRISQHNDTDAVWKRPPIPPADKPSMSSTSDECEWSNSEDETTGSRSLLGRNHAISPPQVQEDFPKQSVPRRPLRTLGDKQQLKSSDSFLQAQISSSPKTQEAKTLRSSTSTKISTLPNGWIPNESNKNTDNYHTPTAQKAASPSVMGVRSSSTSDTAIRARINLSQKKTEYDAATKTGAAIHPSVTSGSGRRRISSTNSTARLQETSPLEAKESYYHKYRLNGDNKPKAPTHPRRIMTISVTRYEENLRSHISQMRDDQSYFTKHKIKSARMKVWPVNPKFNLTKSPFEGISTARCESTVKQDVGKFGHFVKGTNEKANNLVAYRTTSFEQEEPSIPPYTTYIPAKRNILTEDDRQRTFLPYHGDDFEVDDTDKEYAALETKIEENQNRYHRLNKLNDMARMHCRYAERFLLDIGCNIEVVLQYLLDESNGLAPTALTSNCSSFWELRTSYLEDGYYEEEDDQEALDRQDTPYQAKPRKQWQQLYEQLPRASDEQLAIACVACKVFQDVVGFSLFHIVSSYNPGTEFTSHPYSIGTYAELACFICKAHECPGHGEYHDTEEGKNTRERVNFKPGTPDPEFALPYRINNEDITELLGLRDDGEAVGVPWTNFRESASAGFPDGELCHEDCFWAKQARITDLSVWQNEDNEAFQMLRPAYEFERRGPCLMAQCGLIRKSCKEIFLKLLMEPAARHEYSAKIQNELDSTTVAMPPRRTTDQWFDDPKSGSAWRQDQREPFVPCDHVGPCTETTGCSCFGDGVHCEKSCACSDKCTRRFQGCRCHAKGRPCRTEKCECRRFNRECDPDLCINCEADEVLDPANRHNEEAIAGKCTNASIQRGVPKRTLLAPSRLMADGGKSGWGLYMGEECKKGDFIGEYRGEIISEAEADQRGTIYDKRNLSYLFGLNGAQLLDSTLIGNKLRFINHQAEPWANCFAKLLLCNGVVRIGMFAQKDIAISEEMFFNYGENFATKFDLIKMNADGSVTVERPQKGSKSREVFKRRLPIDLRNSHYQLKNKVSKNGQRLGRPPKSSDKSDPPSIASQSTTSNKRFRSEVSDNDADYGPSSSKRESENGLSISKGDSESEVERVVRGGSGSRNAKRRRFYSSPSDVSNDISEDMIGDYRRHRLRGTRQPASQLSHTSTQSPASSDRSGLPDYKVMTRNKSKSQSLQRDLSIPTSSPSRRTSRLGVSLRSRVAEEDSLADEGEVEEVGEEEDEEDELTPRRSSRRRLGKQHFDAPTGSSAGTPPTIRRRTARK